MPRSAGGGKPDSAPVTPQVMDAALKAGSLPPAWASLMPDADATTALSVVWLSRVARLWEATLDRHLRAHGLVPSEFRVLSSLLLSPPARQSLSRLNDAVIISPGGVTKAVNRLAGLGLITKEVDPGDRRSVLVSLSRTGRRRTTELLREVMAAFGQQTAELDPRRRREVAVALRALLSTFPGQPEVGFVGEGG